ncbi:MAG: chemotaxis protein CheX [Acidobacteria bacterium]|nr:chemotaxis protein CheX [Acidobacteriota bacterium]
MNVVEQVDLGAALVESFREVMETLFALPYDGPGTGGEPDSPSMTGIIGLAGPEFRGLLRFSCAEATARRLAGMLLGDEELAASDPAVADSLGELANILGGSVKRRIEASGIHLELSLPSVLAGRAQMVNVGASAGAQLNWRIEGKSVETALMYNHMRRR